MASLEALRGRTTWLIIGIALGALTVAGYDQLTAPDGRRNDAQPTSTVPGSPAQSSRQTKAPSTPTACYLGVVLARESVDLAAEIGGRIDEITARLGDQVRTGELIASLDTRALDHDLAREQAAFRTAEARWKKAALEADQSQHEHQRRVALGDLVSEEKKESSRFELGSATLAVEVAEAELAQVRERLRQLEVQRIKSEVRAPFDGTVATRYLDAGAIADPGTPIVRLISSGDLLARFAVPAEDTASLAAGVEVRIEIESPRLDTSGKIDRLAPEINSASQMIFVEASVALASGETPAIPSGTIAWVSIATSRDVSNSCLPR